MLLLEVIEPLQDMDWKTVLTVLITVGMSLLGYKIKDWWTVFKSNQFKMVSHPIMPRLYKAEQDIEYWKVPESREVLQDSFLIMTKVLIDETKILLDSLDEKNLNKFELAKKLNIYVTEITSEYHRAWRDQGIPKPIIQKFDSSYKSKLTLLHERIENVCGNDVMYLSYKIKAISFFDTMSILLSEMKNECVEMMFMTSFNGDLKGVMYKYIPINDEEYENYLKEKNNGKKDNN